MSKCKMCNMEFSKRFKFNGKRIDYRSRVNCYNCVPVRMNNYDKDFIEFLYGSESKYKSISEKYNHDVDGRKQIYKNSRIYVYTERLCPGCDTIFSKSRNGKYCPKCVAKIKIIGKRHFSVEYKGGKCELCGWKPENISGYICLDFHHKDGVIKDFEFNKISHQPIDIIIKELEKCKMLCAVCHRLEHQIVYKDDIVDAAKKMFLKYLPVPL